MSDKQFSGGKASHRIIIESGKPFDNKAVYNYIKESEIEERLKSIAPCEVEINKGGKYKMSVIIEYKLNKESDI